MVKGQEILPVTPNVMFNFNTDEYLTFIQSVIDAITSKDTVFFYSKEVPLAKKRYCLVVELEDDYEPIGVFVDKDSMYVIGVQSRKHRFEFLDWNILKPAKELCCKSEYIDIGSYSLAFGMFRKNVKKMAHNLSQDYPVISKLTKPMFYCALHISEAAHFRVIATIVHRTRAKNIFQGVLVKRWFNLLITNWSKITEIARTYPHHDNVTRAEETRIMGGSIFSNNEDEAVVFGWLCSNPRLCKYLIANFCNYKKDELTEAEERYLNWKVKKAAIIEKQEAKEKKIHKAKDFLIPNHVILRELEAEYQKRVPACPILVFVNTKSGEGKRGEEVLRTYQELLNTNQAIDLSKQAPKEVLQKFYANIQELKKKGDLLAPIVKNKLRILVYGDDATFSRILNLILELKLASPPPVASMLLQRGSNIPFTFGWVGKKLGIDLEFGMKCLNIVRDAIVVKLYRYITSYIPTLHTSNLE